jgi:hypothetical protein
MGIIRNGRLRARLFKSLRVDYCWWLLLTANGFDPPLMVICDWIVCTAMIAGIFVS